MPGYHRVQQPRAPLFSAPTFTEYPSLRPCCGLKVPCPHGLMCFSYQFLAGAVVGGYGTFWIWGLVGGGLESGLWKV